MASARLECSGIDLLPALHHGHKHQTVHLSAGTYNTGTSLLLHAQAQVSCGVVCNAGGVVRAGPPPVTNAAAAAAGTAVASVPGQTKAPAQSASSSKGVAAKAPLKQPVVQNGRPAEQEQASTQPAPAAGLNAVASAVPSGTPAGSVAAQPTPAVPVASKPQSAASKSLAASASKVAAGMASKAASAKSNKHVKPKT